MFIPTKFHRVRFSLSFQSVKIVPSADFAIFAIQCKYSLCWFHVTYNYDKHVFLLGCNSHAIEFTLLNCTISDF